MKRTIQINICDQPFQLEDDAYRILSEYLQCLSEHFKNDPLHEELMQDFERRIGELFQEKIRLGQSIITSHIVTEVISRVGLAEQICDEDDHSNTFTSSQENPTAASSSERSYKNRKYYRDPQNGVLFGVLSGLSAYLGVDANLLRIIYIILLFTPINIPLFLSYIAMGMFTKKARTITERMEMKGEKVSPNTIWKKIEEESSNLTEQVKDYSQKLDDKYNVHDQVQSVVTEIKAEAERTSWKKWFWGAIIVSSIIVLCACLFWGIAYFFRMFGAGNELWADSLNNGYYYWRTFFPDTSVLALIFLITIPTILLVCLLLGLFFFVLIYPIGLIIRSHTTPIVKVILVVLWFTFLYFIQYIF